MLYCANTWSISLRLISNLCPILKSLPNNIKLARSISRSHNNKDQSISSCNSNKYGSTSPSQNKALSMCTTIVKSAVSYFLLIPAPISSKRAYEFMCGMHGQKLFLLLGSHNLNLASTSGCALEKRTFHAHSISFCPHFLVECS